MNRTLLTGILLVTLLILGGATGWLMIGQQELQEQITLKETEVALGEATLVALFAQKRDDDQQGESALETAEAEIARLQTEVTAVAPLVETQAAGSGLPTPTAV